MDELYAFDLKSLTWECIVPKGSRPAARYLHTAVVIKDAMVVFGGSDSALGDVWSFSFESRRWTQLSKVRQGTPPQLNGCHVCIQTTLAHMFHMPAIMQGQ